MKTRMHTKSSSKRHQSGPNNDSLVMWVPNIGWPHTFWYHDTSNKPMTYLEHMLDDSSFHHPTLETNYLIIKEY